MTNEERDLIQQFIARVGGPPAGGFGGSVPSTTPSAPIDREADAFIADQFNRFPEARYRLTQLAFVQEHALVEAQNQLNRLQWELQNLKQQQAQAPAAPAASPWGAAAQQPTAAQPSRGFFGGLFGGQQAAPPQQYQPQPQYAPPPQPQYAPPPPQYAPGYQPGMFQQRGSGFLGSALTTAAGVAGGMVAGNALMNLLSGHHGGYEPGFGGGGFGGGGFPGGGFSGAAQPTGFVPVADPASSPWGSAPSGDSYEVGGLPKDAPADNQAGGWQDAPSDNSGWQDAPSDGGGWQDAPSDGGGGGLFDSSGGGDDNIA
jgi:hypothetical protein